MLKRDRRRPDLGGAVEHFVHPQIPFGGDAVLIGELTEALAADDLDQLLPLEHGERPVDHVEEGKADLVGDRLGGNLIAVVDELEDEVGDKGQFESGLRQ